MINIIVELSKYLMIALMLVYTFECFAVFNYTDEYTQRSIFRKQNVLMFLLHMIAFLVMYLQTNETKMIGFYGMQVVLFLAVILLYTIIYPRVSRLVVNNMCMLMAVGFVMIARLSYTKCVKQFAIAVAGTLLTLAIPWLLKTVKSFRKMGWIYCGTGLVLLLAVLLGNKIYGANLVLTVGPVSVQPAEFVKILYVMFVASMFNKATTFRQTAVVTAFAALHVIILVLSTDLGAALIFFVVYIAMLYIATKNVLYAGAGIMGGGVAGVIAYKLFSHVRKRVIIWKDPWSHIDDSGYQVCQSLFSIGMGSWFGYGFCQGMPDKIPVAEKDFMFSAISEEFGLIFAISLLLVCLNNLILMMNIASRCKTLFYRLVAVGLGVTYGFQVFLTVGGAIKLIPMTGVTLPFVSYGGSSIISSLVMFALINGMYNMRLDESEYEDDRKGKNAKKQSTAKTTPKKHQA